jgi:hypothetical protein
MEGAGKKYPHHVQKDNNNQNVGAPVMNVANKLPEPDILLKKNN